MREEWVDLYSELSTDDYGVKAKELSQGDDQYDDEAHQLYKQAHHHRERLITFYIRYIVWFSITVGLLISMQAAVRVLSDKTFEIMPEWTLNLLVTGMFVQFIGLLKIVTENVWDFKSFFKHHSSMKNGMGSSSQDK